MNDYLTKTDRYGRLWIWTAVVIIAMVPVAVCLYYDAWPQATAVLKGLLGVAPIYWTVGFIEVLTYTPHAGGGRHLSGLRHREPDQHQGSQRPQRHGERPGIPRQREGEVISTIAIATSSIVTTLVIILGVVMLSALAPVLNSPVMAPAFDNILPALFGGLAVVYISKNWKLAVTPLVFMVAVFLAFPSLSGSVGILVPVGVLVTLGAARLMYNKGWL